MIGGEIMNRLYNQRRSRSGHPVCQDGAKPLLDDICLTQTSVLYSKDSMQCPSSTRYCTLLSISDHVDVLYENRVRHIVVHVA
jgi:hypothetical protein